MKIRTYHIDAFTQEPFKGNPAAVCLIPYEFVHDRSNRLSSGTTIGDSSIDKRTSTTLTDTNTSSLSTYHIPIDKVFAAIAAEFNLSETAFIIPFQRCSNNNPDGNGNDYPEPHQHQPKKDGEELDIEDDPFLTNHEFQLRWFTPTTEVNLCGHATLASSQALYQYGNRHHEFHFHTLSGILKVTNNSTRVSLPLTSPSTTSEPLGTTGDPSSSNPLWAMQFPYNAPILRPWLNDAILKNELLPSSLRLPSSVLTDPTILESSSLSLFSSLSAAQGIPSSTDSLVSSSIPWILPNEALLTALIHSIHYNVRTKKLIIRLHDSYASLLPYFQPDTKTMVTVNQSSYEVNQRITGVSITVKSTPSSSPTIDFFSRYFSPWNGIPEDPVNGSSHTLLGPYWCTILQRYGPYTPLRVLLSNENDSGTYCQRIGQVIGYQQSIRTGVLYLRVCESIQENRNAAEKNNGSTSTDDHAEVKICSTCFTASDYSNIEDKYSYVELGGYAVTIASGYLTI